MARWQPDEAMRTYLQEKAGAGATGYTVEEFDIHLGPGRNGKGKFFGQLMYVLGSYAIQPHESLVVAQKYEQHETVIADLFGVRLAVAGENKKAVRLNETKIKNLTGGDQLRARRMKEDRWSFWPSHCLMMHTNYKPIITGTDDGIWERVKLNLWTVTIPSEERDPTLADKLRAEASQTLNWIVDGARRWLTNGQRFTVPALVEKATADYRAGANVWYNFLSFASFECTDCFSTAELLFEGFCAWRHHPNHKELPPSGSKDGLTKYLAEKYQRDRATVSGKQVRGYRGIAFTDEFTRWLDIIRQYSPHLLQPTTGDQVYDWSQMMESGRSE